MQCDFAVQAAAQWDFRWLVQILNDWVLSSLGIALKWARHWMMLISPWNGAFSRLQFVWAKICLIPHEDHSNLCSTSLDVSMGDNSTSDSTNLSKSSSVCCHLPLQTCQTLANHSFNIPSLPGTHYPNAEWVCDLLDIKSKYVLNKNQFLFVFLLFSSKTSVSFSPSCCIFLHSLEFFLPISLLLFNHMWSFDRRI